MFYKRSLFLKHTLLKRVSIFVFISSITIQKKKYCFLFTKSTVFPIEKGHTRNLHNFLHFRNFQPSTSTQRTINFNVTSNVDIEKVKLLKQNTRNRYNFASPELLLTFCSLPNDRLVFTKRFLVNSVTKVKA